MALAPRSGERVAKGRVRGHPSGPTREARALLRRGGRTAYATIDNRVLGLCSRTAQLRFANSSFAKRELGRRSAR